MQPVPTEMVYGEVSWKTAKTFDVFQTVWEMNGQVLADQRSDINGVRYVRCAVPKNKLPALHSALRKVDHLSNFYQAQ